MPNLSVIIASGEQVVADMFVEADDFLQDVANATAARLAVTTSRCVLLSPGGDRIQTPSDEQLADGDVITVLVMGVPQVFAYGRGSAFAAVKGDGSVVTWGDDECGVNSDVVKSELAGGVKDVVGNGLAFAAIKGDGSVVTWGMESYGDHLDTVPSDLQCGVLMVVGNSAALAAIKEVAASSRGEPAFWRQLRQGKIGAELRCAHGGEHF